MKVSQFRRFWNYFFFSTYFSGELGNSFASARHYQYVAALVKEKETGAGCRERMSNDESLMLEFQRGSSQAFQTLFERYRVPLYAFFYRRLGSRERAEDLTQDTFVAVIRSTDRYEPLATVRTYLYSIATNLLLGERRKQVRRSVTMESGNASEELQEYLLDPDDVLWVRQCLQKLEPLEREILMLREYEQLSYAEIAEVLGLPVNTVRSRLFRSREALRSQLQPAEKASDDSHRYGPSEATEMGHV